MMMGQSSLNKKSQSLMIKNAQAVMRSSQEEQLSFHQVDIYIENGVIKEIGSSLSRPAESFFNARGLVTLPGVIDTQVHFREPGLTHKEDLESGSRSALLGGVTTFFEMPNTLPSTTSLELFQEKLSRAQGRSFVDYAFYIGGSIENAEQLAQLETAPHCCGVKVFVGSSTGTMLVEDDLNIEKILRSGQRRVTFHSEDEFILRERKKIAQDSHDVKMHPVWRNVESALSSTQRILHLARKCQRPVHILHVTSAEEIDFLQNQKDIATIEILPQHLTLSAPECYDRLGTLAQQNPPIREKYHQDRLWKAIQDGTADILGSDHAPHTLEEKARQYPLSPSGMPGVQTMLPIMLNHVHNGKLSLFRLVELLCEAPKKVFGLQNKGQIAVGFDADFTFVDLNRIQTIENKWIASRAGWSPFDGMQVQGWPIHVIQRGHVTLRDGEIQSPPIGTAVSFRW